MSEEAHNAELLAMAAAHFNEPMICGFDVVRCIGYGETGVDCYIICRHRGGKIVWHTCVERFDCGPHVLFG